MKWAEHGYETLLFSLHIGSLPDREKGDDLSVKYQSIIIYIQVSSVGRSEIVSRTLVDLRQIFLK